MAHENLIREYMLIPPVTRGYVTACVVTTLAVQMELVSPFQLYLNPLLITQKFEVWRLVTPFFFFGTLGFNFLFNLIFTYRYCRMLEEGSFRGRPADFLFLFIFGGFLTITSAWFLNLLFLGHALTIMFVYIWGRRNPFVRMNFFGLLPFRAPYLPWVLVAFSVLMGNSIMVDILGISIGHLYYFLEDVFPNQPGGRKLLHTPRFLQLLFAEQAEDPNYEPPLEAREARQAPEWPGLVG